jgi:hypothetical protein
MHLLIEMNSLEQGDGEMDIVADIVEENEIK